jgi:viroplasmin and RNaseH domain-containing protein
MKRKVYAVRKGRIVGLYKTWEECEKQVKGYKGAEYKSFKTTMEVNGYMNRTEVKRKNTKVLDFF